MTRLISQDIEYIPSSWLEYDKKMRQAMDAGLVEICARAIDRPLKDLEKALDKKKVYVVPVSAGQGMIEGFDRALASIAAQLGCRPLLLPPDSFGQALTNRDGLLIWADDDFFYAENLQDDSACENGWATGRGFAAALACMAEKKGVARRTLVLGAGPVGASAAEFLCRHGFAVTLCDIRPDAARTAAATLPGCAAADPAGARPGGKFDCLLDASPTDAFFPEDLLFHASCVSAPCVPCHWRSGPERPVWHDPLQLGTAVMLAAAAMGVSSPRAHKA